MPESPRPPLPPPPSVFISYSRKDEKWKAILDKFLKPARDEGLITLSDDPALEYGVTINTAQVAVLLISPDFIASQWAKARKEDLVEDHQISQILTEVKERNLRLLPVLLRPCAWQTVGWLADFAIYPPDGKALVGSGSQDQLFNDAARHIVDVAIATTRTSGSATPDELRLATGSDPRDGLTVNMLSSFELSNEARNILRRAQVLGTFGNVDAPIVTSSCLLFAIAEGGRDQSGNFRTPQFFWRALQRADADAYQQIFRERFPSATYSSSAGIVPFDQLRQLADAITENVLSIFQRAREISLVTRAIASSKSDQSTNKRVHEAETEYPGHIGARHLLAALLVVNAARPISTGTPPRTSAVERLSKILDVAQMRIEFLDFIQRSTPDDDFQAWQLVLGVEATPDTEPEQKSAVEDVEELGATLAGFSADTWDGADLLDITRDVNALASLVAARSIDPPLSIGLFGDWGSGKTHFMRQMKARVQKLSQKARDSGKPQSELGYHKKIVQIEFNAWHYIEGNLWASLVEHIFSNLRITSQKGEVEDAKEAILEQLGVKQELQKKLEQRKTQLKSKAEAAKGRAEEAKNKRDDTSHELVNLRDASEAKVIDGLTTLEVSPEQKALLKQLGMPEGTELVPSEIRKTYQQVRTLEGQIRAGWNVFWADPKRARKAMRIIVVLAVTVVAGALATVLAGRFGWPYIKAAAGVIASVVAFIGSFLAAAKPYYEKFKKGTAALKEKYDQVEKERQKQIVALESEVNSLTREMNQAENEAKAITKEVTTLEAQLKSTDAARLLAGFIEDRAACEDYRRHLGVLALIRRDFEKLSNLLSEQRPDESEFPEQEKAFSRIILYIDDLDRCPPEKVVKVLQAIHLLLAFRLFVVVVGVDARWVTRSLRESYDWLGAEEDHDQPNQEKREMVEDRTVTPHDYLEKIFQIPFWLKPMGDKDCENLLDGLTKKSRARLRASQNGHAKKETGREEGIASPSADVASSAATGQTQDKPAAEQAPVPPAQTETEDVALQGAATETSSETDDATETAGPEQEAVKTAASDQKDEGEEEAIDLTPQSLTLTESEIEYMKKLASLIGRSPRAVKRFLNCYRLIKVGLNPAELRLFVGRDGQQGRFSEVMILLGIITGAPSVSLFVIEELEECSRSKKSINLNTLLLKLEKNPEVTRQSDWIHVREILEDQIGSDDSQITIETLIKETPRVSRYSFRVAKAAAGQKRIGTAKSKPAPPGASAAP